ncbi:MAG TPA: hypothetical protein P5040_03050 [Smithella sp.]|nr:hypothetical protein [Smithella sp.]HRS97136.1 hypothetical protein [Smithella sp.]
MAPCNNHVVENHKKFLWLVLSLALALCSCIGEIGTTVIPEADEYSRVYEAKEAVILRAVAGVFKEKSIGTNVTIDYKNNVVSSDYLETGSWRTRARAHVNRLNWKECEVQLAVVTEKKGASGWEKRRLLQKEQYDTFFDVIELRIYEEMSKVE